MPRDIDERKKRKALRKLRKAAQLAEQGLGPPLSDWEVQFLEEVEERIETYGSAFADPEKGAQDEPLSALQKQKLREIDKKARGKGKYGDKGASDQRRSSFKSKANSVRKYGRDINDDVDDPDEIEATSAQPIRPAERKLELVKEDERPSVSKPIPSSPTPEPEPVKKRSAFRVIDGGKSGA